MATIIERKQQAYGTATAWTALNPTLMVGEIGYESDTGKFKFGDGTTAWTSLSYVSTGGTGGAPLNSPNFTGNPTAPTPSPGDADTSLATTAFVANALNNAAFLPKNADLTTLGIFLPEAHGAVGDGVTDDSAALTAAFNAAYAAKNGVVLLTKLYGWKGDLLHRGGITVQGAGGWTARTSSPTQGLRALDGTARYLYGSFTSSGGIDVNPGPLTNLVIDGNNVGGSTPGFLFKSQCVDGYVANVYVVHSAGGHVELGGTQNTIFDHLFCGLGTGVSLSLQAVTGEQGAGGNKFRNCYVTTSTAKLLHLGPTPSNFAPHDNLFDGCMFENYNASASSHLVHIEAGNNNVMRHCVFTESTTTGSITSQALILVEDNDPLGGTFLLLDTPFFNGGGSGTLTDAVRVRHNSGYGSSVSFVGAGQVSNVSNLLCSDNGTLAGSYSAKIYVNPGINYTRSANGGTFSNMFHQTFEGMKFRTSSLVKPLDFARDTSDTNFRFQTDRDGNMVWGNGTSGVQLASIGHDGAGMLSTTGVWRISNGFRRRAAVQLVSSANQAITIAPDSDNTVLIGFTANATTSIGSVTITPPTATDAQLRIGILTTAGWTNTITGWDASMHWIDPAPTAADPGGQFLFYDFVYYNGGWYQVKSTRSTTPQTIEYTTAQTNTAYTIPIGAKVLQIEAQGGGGGGGAGRRGAAATVRCGGGGGQSGARNIISIPVSDLGATATLYITVGAGGAGGAAQTADSTDGAAGTDGGSSYVATSTTLNQTTSVTIAGNGVHGNGGSATAGAGGTSIQAGMFGGATGGSASASGGAGNFGGVSSTGPGAGGSGGGITSADAQSAGGNGGYNTATYGVAVSGGTSGGGAGGAGGTNPILTPGYGGAGGGSNTGGAGGTGGAGSRGGGGGGGGASLNGNNSGAGGRGGDGYVKITALF